MDRGFEFVVLGAISSTLSMALWSIVGCSRARLARVCRAPKTQATIEAAAALEKQKKSKSLKLNKTQSERSKKSGNSAKGRFKRLFGTSNRPTASKPTEVKMSTARGRTPQKDFWDQVIRDQERTAREARKSKKRTAEKKKERQVESKSGLSDIHSQIVHRINSQRVQNQLDPPFSHRSPTKRSEIRAIQTPKSVISTSKPTALSSETDVQPLVVIPANRQFSRPVVSKVKAAQQHAGNKARNPKAKKPKSGGRLSLLRKSSKQKTKTAVQ
ncbi:hypothetical protein M3Y96_01013300 [Aphelenchoides besseyi]|nr:hypothetical protein M3Y96_01013300 [Aphelenchoides besseyi]